MYDFIQNIDLHKIKNCEFINSMHIETYIHEYLLNLYGRVLELCYKYNKIIDIARIQKEYFGDCLILNINNYSNKLIDVEKSVMNKLPIGGNYELNRKEDKIAVISFLLNEYRERLNKELSGANKECILSIIYGISSILSYISVNSIYLFKHKVTDTEEKDKSIQNMIIDSIGLIYNEAELEINEIFGLEKKSCEYLINLILNEKFNYAEIKKSRLNIENIFLFTNKIVETLTLKKSINNLSHYGTKLRIRGNILCFDNNFTDRIKSYADKAYESTIDLNSVEAKKIFIEFEKKEGYSINILEKYVNELDNKNLNINCIGNLVEDNFLYFDINLCTGASIESIKKIIQALSLKRIEKNIEDDIFSINNRIFRTPIIKISNYFLISNYLLIEASHYFRYRILRKELSSNGDLKKKITKLYDERELSNLKMLLEKYEVFGGINLKLQSIKEVKSLFTKDGVSKEIDFYFIFNKTLYTMEYKNQDIDRNIYDISKTYNRNEGYVNKHLRMIEIIKKNKVSFEKAFRKEFVDIKSFLVFKYKNSFPDFYRGSDIFSCSYKEFYNWCEEFLKHNN